MVSEAKETPLNIVLLPFPQPGHMIPIVDFANMLASNGVNCTVITTPANAPLFRHNSAVTTVVLDFPASEVGLPSGIENFSSCTEPGMTTKLFRAIMMLKNPTEHIIRDIAPDCIISDMFYPWTCDLALEIGCPRLMFESSVFVLSCANSIKKHTPHERVESDAETVVLPELPDRIEMRKSQLPEWVRVPTPYTHMKDKIKEAEFRSYGIVANTFEGLEKRYLDHYRATTGLKVWPIGPVSAQSHSHMQKAARGKDGSSAVWADCLEWLDRKEPESVLYVTFGSLTKHSAEQMREIAAGLEQSGHNFLWVALARKREEEKTEKDVDEWLPQGFRERLRESNKGLIIEDWAPQLLILEHKSIGGMVTHCGWNSIMEGINAGLPFVTWPGFAEQFYNERLLVDVLGVGIAVGVTTWCELGKEEMKEIVARDKVEAAVRRLMGDGEAAAMMRQRSKELARAAKSAVQEGGSSQLSLLHLIRDLKATRFFF